MEKILTAEEFLIEIDDRLGTLWTEDDSDICKVLDEYANMKARYYVIEALRQAAIEYGFDITYDNCYPLENIK